MSAASSDRPADGDWARHAACISTPHLMFPDMGDAAGRTAARAVCARCPVRADCLTDALAQDDDGGVRGGLTVHERAALRRTGRTTPAPRRRHRRKPPAAAAPREPQSARQPAPLPNPALRCPELLAPDGVLVNDDGSVALDDRAWLVASIVMQRQVDMRRARSTGPGLGDRRVGHQRAWLCGLLHKLGHGVGWKAIPVAYGHHSTIRKLHRRLVEDGMWDDVVAALGPYDDLEELAAAEACPAADSDPPAARAA